MAWIATAVVASSVISSTMSSKAQSDAASTAAEASSASTDASISEQRRQFDLAQKLLAPYADAGKQSMAAQQNLLGLGGAEAQQQAIAGIEGSPQFAALMEQGENAMLQNASATGGLRGGNIQGALAQFRPQLLNQMIDSQFSKLGSITGLGQASAAGQAASAQDTGNSISSLMAQHGQNQAAAALAAGQGRANAWGSIGSGFGSAAAMYGMNKGIF